MWGAALAAGAGGLGSALSGFGMSSTGHQQRDSILQGVNQANNQIQQGYNTANQQLSPFAQAYQNALLPQGVNMNNPGGLANYFESTPGYQFQMQQGLKGVQNSAAAKGGLLSGAAMKAMNDYAQGQAGAGYQQWLQNINNPGVSTNLANMAQQNSLFQGNNIMQGNTAAANAAAQGEYGKYSSFGGLSSSLMGGGMAGLGFK